MIPYKLRPYLAIILCLSSLTIQAQESRDAKENNTLFIAGHASAFIGGLYDGYLPYHQLKLHGDFGLGAPDKIDGELLVLNGKYTKPRLAVKPLKYMMMS